MGLSTSRKNLLLSSERYGEEKNFWKDYLIESENLNTHLPYDENNDSNKAYSKSSIEFTVPANTDRSIQKIVSNSQMGYYMILVSVVNMILENHVNGEHIGLGIPVVTKGTGNQEYLSKMLPMVNPVLRFKEKRYIEYLKELMSNLRSIDQNKNIPFAYITECLGEYGTKTYRDVYGAAVVLDGIQDKNEIEKLQLDSIFSIDTNERSTKIKITYNSKLYKKSSIQNIGEKILNILEQVSSHPKKKISEIDFLNSKEKEIILNQFNDTTREYPKEKSVKDLFEEQCRLVPGKRALVYNGKSISYQELNEKSNQAAHLLRKEGVQEGTVVGLSLKQGFDRFVGILGIIKAGGVFLPIDDEYPAARKAFMLKDSAAQLLISDTENRETLNFDGKIISLTDERLEAENKADLKTALEAKNLIYIMYTSGSTGTPKGVMVEHRNVVRLVKDTEFIRFQDRDKMLQGSTVVFDASTFEIWGALLNGLELHLVDKETMLDARKLEEKLRQNQITIMWMTAPLFNQISKNEPSMFQGLNYLLVGGDALSLEPIEKVRSACPDLKILNGYGPTENTTFSTTHLIEKGYTKTIPIGKPITNSKAYIVDKDMNLQSIGAVGEIYVGGDGVSRGYINNDELSRERFIDSPFIEGERLYRTGDLGRWLEDGSIEFLGRTDHQVKVRGYRIEVGEIENVLNSHPLVKEATVLIRERGENEKYISAYVVLNGDDTDGITSVTDYVWRTLPDYMQPSFIVPVDRIPLTINGKIDKSALINKENEIIANNFEEPKNELEMNLSEIWKDLFQRKKISINHSFFDLGGNSLIAIKLINMIRNQFKCNLELADILSNVTIKTLAKHINKQRNKGITEKLESPIIHDSSLPTLYEASPLQRRIYMADVMTKASVSYNIPIFLKSKGIMDVSLLEKAANLLVKRHESLRTRFKFKEDKLYQVIDPYKSFLLNVKHVLTSEAEELMKAFIRPFEIETGGNLFRIEVLQVSNKETIIMMDAHHSISDGRSTEILIDELIKAYQGLTLPELKYQYKDFSNVQNDYLTTHRNLSCEEYWENQLKHGDTLIELPFDYEVNTQLEGAELRQPLGNQLAVKVEEISKELNVTNYVTFLTILKILFAKYTQKDNVTIASPVTHRDITEWEHVVGMFVNMLPITSKVNPNSSFVELVKTVSERVLDAHKNKDYQFDKLVEKLKLTRNSKDNPIFNVTFDMHHHEIGHDLHNSKDITFEILESESGISKFDLSIVAIKKGTGISLVFQYNTKAFKHESIKRIAKSFVNILKQIIIDPEVKLSKITLNNIEDKEIILNQFNDTTREYPKEKSVKDLFEEQCRLVPGKRALVYNGKSISYQELNEKSNQAAHLLRKEGVQEGTVVGLSLKQGFDRFVGILGIIKAGGVFLPIDDEYPAARKAFMLKDSAAQLLISDTENREALNFNGKIISLTDERLEAENKADLKTALEAKNLIYIMYTSGSTGTPKGVMVEHRNVVRLVKETEFIRFQDTDKMLQGSTVVFDASTFEIWGALLNGLELHLVDKETMLDARKLEEKLRQNQITIMWMTAPLFNQISKNEPSMFQGLNYLLVGGDALSLEPIEKVRSACPDLKILNGYGPTENTTFSTTHLIEKGYTKTIPIGKPITNSKAYIVDKDMNLQSIGAVGEIYVGGDGVSRGYINNDELSRERFIDSPFIEGERLYRTGDLGRWLEDGSIEFLGRTDHQVKVRGYRIEVGEIENVLNSHPLVKEATVLIRERGENEKYISAYVVLNGDDTDGITSVTDYVWRTLPDYMQPSFIVPVDRIPLTINGKIDKSALINSESSFLKDPDLEEPSSEVEEKLYEIWQEVLKTSSIGVDDNFFEVGGNSILLVSLHQKLTEAFEKDIEIADLFSNPSISSLAQFIEELA
ncbi:amino acid adenylation domain-containing protein [Pseudalkalibacillus sp. SCS-8]|uniref:amino acid adenylation domain-containing protein n=1 Tax=Pseudalkalibacillus nanhaiensis TaxID=3115291 RepID=UPI0032DA2D8B